MLDTAHEWKCDTQRCHIKMEEAVIRRTVALAAGSTQRPGARPRADFAPCLGGAAVAIGCGRVDPGVSLRLNTSNNLSERLF